MKLIDGDKLMLALNEAQEEGSEYYKGLGKAKSILSEQSELKNIIELPLKKGDKLWKADYIFAQIDTPHEITSVTWTDGYFEFEVENSAYYDYDCITVDEIGKTYFKTKSARDKAFEKYVEEQEKAYFNSKLNPSQFKEKYCDKCGSQRCLGPGSEWFDGCAYKNDLLVWGDIYRDFTLHYPKIEVDVNDWRPIDGLSIQIWTKNKKIYHYNFVTKKLKLGKDVYLK